MAGKSGNKLAYRQTCLYSEEIQNLDPAAPTQGILSDFTAPLSLRNSACCIWYIDTIFYPNRAETAGDEDQYLVKSSKMYIKPYVTFTISLLI